MGVTWTLELHCKACSATITYNSEIPDIKHDRNNIIANNRASKFVSDHTSYEEGLDTPENVRVISVSWNKRVYAVEELPTRYTLCPVCGSRVHFE